MFTDRARISDGSAGGGSLLEDGFDLAGVWETACLLLGEDQLVVDGDLEDSTGSLDELRLDAELLLDLLRQTGGAGVVVSDPAVLDDDGRGHTRLLSPLSIASLLFKIGIKWRQRLLFSYKVRLTARAGQVEPGQDWILGLNREYNRDCSIAPHGGGRVSRSGL